jgi:hypothetical protein
MRTYWVNGLFIAGAYFVLVVWAWLIRLPFTTSLFSWAEGVALLVQPVLLYVFLNKQVELAANRSQPFGYTRGMFFSLFCSLVALMGIAAAVLLFDNVIFPERFEALRYERYVALNRQGLDMEAKALARQTIARIFSPAYHLGVVLLCAAPFFVLNSALVPLLVRNEPQD